MIEKNKLRLRLPWRGRGQWSLEKWRRRSSLCTQRDLWRLESRLVCSFQQKQFVQWPYYGPVSFSWERLDRHCCFPWKFLSDFVDKSLSKSVSEPKLKSSLRGLWFAHRSRQWTSLTARTDWRRREFRQLRLCQQAFCFACKLATRRPVVIPDPYRWTAWVRVAAFRRRVRSWAWTVNGSYTTESRSRKSKPTQSEKERYFSQGQGV